MFQIYALTDHDGSIRYIGKANDAAKRFKSHLLASRRLKTPVYAWIRKLVDRGEKPGIIVLEICSDWREAERRLIAEHRVSGARLLNLADGGDEPKKFTDARSERLYRLKRSLGDALKRGQVAEATLQKMRARPDIFGQFFR